ncbi:MAG: caspase family protein [Chitinophagales bacterium]|nr:caspase family protein [Chitinophagales bacterium]
MELFTRSMIAARLLLVCLCCITYWQALYAGAGGSVNKHALIIAIGDYPNPKEYGWAKISCANDVPYIKKSLDIMGFRQIALLQDSQATKQGIIKALEDLHQRTKAGDVVFVSISSHGEQIKDDNGDEADGLDEAIVPYGARYSPRDTSKAHFDSYLRDDLVIELLNNIRSKAGKGGQVVLFSDVDHFSSDDSYMPAESVNPPKGQLIVTRGESFYAEIEALAAKAGGNLSPFVFMAGSRPKEFNYETWDDDSLAVGALSFCFYKCIKNASEKGIRFTNFNHLFYAIVDWMQQKAPRQHPVIAGDVNEQVFVPRKVTEDVEDKFAYAKESTDTTINKNSSAYIISIGISQYSYSNCPKMAFGNCLSDAKLLDSFFTQQSVNTLKGKVNHYLLLNRSAAKDSILSYLNLVIEKTKPEDYFIFNFAGRTDMLTGANGDKEIYFVPFGLQNICDTEEVKSKSISLSQLRGLLQLVQANHQLFVSEAGNSEDFGKMFVKGLIESSPDIASISSKNRVFIVPDKFGLDYFNCKSQSIQGAPISYFLRNISSSRSIFELFGNKTSRNQLVHDVMHQEHACNLPQKPYTTFFFEKELVDDLKYFFTRQEEKQNQRGAAVFNTAIDKAKLTIGKKYALIIGTNEYKEWTNLNNAVKDAEAIANELENGFGFDVLLLRNPLLDTVYSVIQSYSQRMDSTDQLLIYFAGHGDFDEQFFNDGFLVMKNSASTKNDPYRKTYIQHSALQRIINNLPSRQILVVFDVCYGGTFDEKVSKRSYKVNELKTGNTKEDYINKKLEHHTRVYISSGNKNTVPDGYSGEHSPFAIRFLEALRTKGGKSGILTKSRLFSFVEGLDSEPIMGGFGDDEPGSEFILISK